MSFRKDQFKKVGGGDVAREERIESSIRIRKAKKGEQIHIRRRLDGFGAPPEPLMSDPIINVSDNPHVSTLVLPKEGEKHGPSQTMMSEKRRQKLADLPIWVDGLNSTVLETALISTEAIRKLLSSERNPPIEEVVATGIIPRLVAFLAQDESQKLQFESAWALTNIASGTTFHTRMVIDAGAVPWFAHLLSSSDSDVREQAIWGLGNIAGDMVSFRDLVLSTNAMPSLLNLLVRPDENRISVIRNGTWALSNFCRGKPSANIGDINHLLNTAKTLLAQPDEEVATNICWTMCYVSDGKPEHVRAIIESNICARLMGLLFEGDNAYTTPVLRTIGNIVSCDDINTEYIFQIGGLNILMKFLSSSKPEVVRDTCWVLSNILAGPHNQIQAVINARYIPYIAIHLHSGDSRVRLEALWAIANALSGGDEKQVEYVIQCDIIPPICESLRLKDVSVIGVALECIKTILDAGEKEGFENRYAILIEEEGGIDEIEELSVHKDDVVSTRACEIIDLYFCDEDGMMVTDTSLTQEFRFSS